MSVGSESMIERVARAMVPALGFAPDCDWERVWVGNQLDNAETGSLAYMCRSLARAALQALMEPTEAMTRAGQAASSGWLDTGEVGPVWQAMIRSAMEGE